MAVSVSTAGPYFSSGEIKFSDLRKYFRSQVRKTTSGGSETFSPDPSTDTTAISAAELLRVTDTTVENPVVPDSTENNDIATTNDLKVSQFRDSIKYYYVTLPSSDEVINFDIDSQDWNTNLGKNINKFMFIDGTCGSNVASSPAATFEATTYNLTIDVFGSIYGAGGRGGGTGGGAPSINGENGGDALYINSPDGNNILVNVQSTSKIYGGGGGGEKGKNGDAGTKGTCTKVENDVQGPSCGQCPSCSGGTQSNCKDTTQCCQSYNYCCGLFNCACEACSQYVKKATCTYTEDSTTPPATIGGNGGKGQGYDGDATDGLDGGAATSPQCSGGYTLSGGSNSTKAEDGGDGGGWGQNGQDTDNTGDGGLAGAAIKGSVYTVQGSLSSSIKGLYLSS